MSFTNPVTPASSHDDGFSLPQSPPISVWSVEYSPKSSFSLDQQQEFHGEEDEDFYNRYGGPIRRVFSFDEWMDEQPISFPPLPRPKVFHFDGWSEIDSSADDSTNYTTALDCVPQGETTSPRKGTGFINIDPSPSRVYQNESKSLQMRSLLLEKLIPLDTMTTLSSSNSNLSMPNDFQEYYNSLSPSPKSASSSIPNIIIIQKQTPNGGWRRQVTRPWRRIFGDSSYRRSEV